MADKQTLKWVLIVGLLLVVFSMKGNVPAQSVAAIEGQPCINSSDCPCWGKYNVTQFGTPTGWTDVEQNATAYGVGLASCRDTGPKINTCDMTYCLDVKPVGEWMRDKPWEYLRTHSLFAVLIIGLLVGTLVFWPNV